MTNEKDREIADRLIDIWYGIGTKTQVERKSDVAYEIARIRDEAYKEGFLDGCSKDGTQTERDKVMMAEAAREERERCINAAIRWWHDDSEDGGPDDIRRALTPDSASEKEANRG